MCTVELANSPAGAHRRTGHLGYIYDQNVRPQSNVVIMYIKVTNYIWGGAQMQSEGAVVPHPSPKQLSVSWGSSAENIVVLESYRR
jgi:hypothetical protein